MKARRRAVARHDEPLDWPQSYHLRSGSGGPYTDLNGLPAVSGFATLGAAREAWEVHRDQLIEGMLRRGRGGCRPWAFWRFDVGRPDLVRADPDEAIDPADYPGVCPDRVTVRNANGTVSQQPHGGEHAEWCYAAARGRLLHERRLAYLVAHDLLLPGEDPLQGGPDYLLVEPRARL